MRRHIRHQKRCQRGWPDIKAEVPCRIGDYKHRMVGGATASQKEAATQVQVGFLQYVKGEHVSTYLYGRATRNSR